MKIELWGIGKTSEPWLTEGETIYMKRLKNYVQLTTEYFQPGKWTQLSAAQVKKNEANLFLSKLKEDDWVILLDEKGKEYTSENLAIQYQKWLNQGLRRMVFISGGAFGFDDSIYQRANATLSLSRLTFTHQMVRVFILEQLYRAMTILRNEPYHNS